jgi:hypothetical protein
MAEKYMALDARTLCLNGLTAREIGQLQEKQRVRLLRCRRREENNATGIAVKISSEYAMHYTRSTKFMDGEGEMA